MLDALRVIAALLREYSPRQARAVEELMAAHAARDPNFAIDVCGEDLWGPHGLWDTGPQVLQRPRDDADACRRDELAYRAAFRDVATAIEQFGWGTPEQLERIRDVVATFQRWEQDGL